MHVQNPAERERIVWLNCLYVYHKAPDPGESQNKAWAYKNRLGPAKKARRAMHVQNLAEREQIVWLNCLDVDHKSPDSSESQNKARA